jgi:hypothetical protein
MEEIMAERLALFLLQIGIIVICARLIGNLFEKFKLPGVMGELIAGILIGPHLLEGIGFPGFQGGLFPGTGSEELHVSPELFGFSVAASVVLIIAGIGVSSGILTPETFGAAMVMTLVSTLGFSPLLNRLLSGEKPGGWTVKPSKVESSVAAVKNLSIAQLVASHMATILRGKGYFLSVAGQDQPPYKAKRDNREITIRMNDRHIVVESSLSARQEARFLLSSSIRSVATHNLQTRKSGTKN